MEVREANGPTAGEEQPPAVPPMEPAVAVSHDVFLPPPWSEDAPGDRPLDGVVRWAPTASAAPGSVPSPSPASSVVPVWGPMVPDGVGPAGPIGQRPCLPGWTWAVVSLVAALVGALIGGGIVAASDHGDGSTTVKEISSGPALLNGVTNIESVIAKVLPAIVSIDATSPQPVIAVSVRGDLRAACRRTRGRA